MYNQFESDDATCALTVSDISLPLNGQFLCNQDYLVTIICFHMNDYITSSKRS